MGKCFLISLLVSYCEVPATDSWWHFVSVPPASVPSFGADPSLSPLQFGDPKSKTSDDDHLKTRDQNYHLRNREPFLVLTKPCGSRALTRKTSSLPALLCPL
jgi:hypothetical protein